MQYGSTGKSLTDDISAGISRYDADRQQLCTIDAEVFCDNIVQHTLQAINTKNQQKKASVADTQNIILIGMPSCGKTTVGTALAKIMGRQFLDSDEEIIRRYGKNIPQIFAEDGEEVFRRIEIEVIAEISKSIGCVIATGGGVVVKEENYMPLKQSGIICWLHRPIPLLSTSGRPLSLNSLDEMFKIRAPLYSHFSDFSVNNTGTIDDTAKKIAKIFYTENYDY